MGSSYRPLHATHEACAGWREPLVGRAHPRVLHHASSSIVRRRCPNRHPPPPVTPRPGPSAAFVARWSCGLGRLGLGTLLWRSRTLAAGTLAIAAHRSTHGQGKRAVDLTQGGRDGHRRHQLPHLHHLLSSPLSGQRGGPAAAGWVLLLVLRMWLRRGDGRTRSVTVRCRTACRGRP
jgi:hypothetical protein